MKAEEIQCSSFHRIKQSGYSKESSVFLVIQLLDSQSLESLTFSVDYRVVIAQHLYFGGIQEKVDLSLFLCLSFPHSALHTSPISRFSWAQKVGEADCGVGTRFPVASMPLRALSAWDGNRNGSLHFPGRRMKLKGVRGFGPPSKPSAKPRLGRRDLLIHDSSLLSSFTCWPQTSFLLLLVVKITSFTSFITTSQKLSLLRGPERNLVFRHSSDTAGS